MYSHHSTRWVSSLKVSLILTFRSSFPTFCVYPSETSLFPHFICQMHICLLVGKSGSPLETARQLLELLFWERWQWYWISKLSVPLLNWSVAWFYLKNNVLQLCTHHFSACQLFQGNTTTLFTLGCFAVASNLWVLCCSGILHPQSIVCEGFY